jgi:hypothetical protein
LTEVYCEVDERKEFVVSHHPAYGNRLTEVGFVLHPVDVNVQMTERIGIDVAGLEQREKS